MDEDANLKLYWNLTLIETQSQKGRETKGELIFDVAAIVVNVVMFCD